MSEDPARARFFTIHAVRIAGVACVVLGMLIATQRASVFGWGPPWFGYLLIANGLVDVFVIPAKLVRKWRTPE